MANKVSYLIQLQDRFSRQANKISLATQKIAKRMNEVEEATKRADKKLNNFASSSKKIGLKMAKIGAGLLSATIAPALGFKASVKQSVKMEDAMSDIARVTSASGDQLISFENTLERMSEKLGKSKVGLAQMAFEGGKLGTKLKDMEPFLLMVSKTAIAFDLQDEEAGRAIGSIRAKMGLMNKDTRTLLDSVNFLADNTSASGARMINVIERLSGTMALLKVPPKATAALAGFSDQLEISSELAASGMNMFIQRMKRFPGMTTKLMNDPLETIRETLTGIAKMGPEVQSKFIRVAFGDEAGRFVQKMVANIELFDKTVTAALSPKAAGSMQRELENILKRSSKAFEIFSETSTNTLDSIGDAIKPLITTVAKFITPIINGIGEIAKKNPDIVQFAFVITAVTATIGALSLVFSVLALAVGFITAPVLLAAAAIGLLAAVGVMIVNRWDDMKGGAMALVNSFSDMISGFGEIKTIIIAVGLAVVAFAAPFLAPVVAIGLLITAGALLISHWDDVKAGAKALWDSITGIFSSDEIDVNVANI